MRPGHLPHWSRVSTLYGILVRFDGGNKDRGAVLGCGGVEDLDGTVRATRGDPPSVVVKLCVVLVAVSAFVYYNVAFEPGVDGGDHTCL